MPLVRVVSDTGCERIHKEKKVQRAKFLFYSPKRGKELGAEICTSTEGWGCEFLLDYNWIIKGWGVLLCGPWAVGGFAAQEISAGFAKAAVFSNVIFCLWL